jgi:hypothetical protein
VSIAVASSASVSGDGGSLATITLTGVTSGDTIVVEIGAGFDVHGLLPTAPTDNKGNTYHLVGTVQSGGTVSLATYYAYNVASGTTTITINTTSYYCCGPIYAPVGAVAYDVTGVTTSDPLDQHAQGTSTSGNITTTQASEILFGGAVGNPFTPTADSGYTLTTAPVGPPSFHAGTAGAEYKVVSSTGTYSVSFGGSGAFTNIASFKAAASAAANSDFLVFF